MIVVSDTTPIHYLILVREESILPAVFDEVIIPEAVAKEMRHPKAPATVREWIDDPPAWARIEHASPRFLERIDGLGRGESAAIAIAVERHATAVLMDDRKAIREARNNGLTVLTTFAVLELAALKGLIELDMVLDKLSRTTFRMPSEEIVDEYLKRYRERNL
jgi:uncharacterized protein